jgi:hypothetical protein
MEFIAADFFAVGAEDRQVNRRKCKCRNKMQDVNCTRTDSHEVSRLLSASPLLASPGLSWPLLASPGLSSPLAIL